MTCELDHKYKRALLKVQAFQPWQSFCCLGSWFHSCYYYQFLLFYLLLLQQRLKLFL